MIDIENKDLQKIQKDSIQKDTIDTIETELKNQVKRLDSFNKSLEWKKLRCGLYINKNNEIGFEYYFALESGISTTDYRTYLCCGEERALLKSVIDTTTFTYLGSTFYKDKKHIYHYYDMAGGGRFYIYKGVDHASFRVVGDCYAKDKNNIYGERAGILEKVDYTTFKSLKGIGPYAKDKYAYYFWDNYLFSVKKLDSLAKSKDSDDIELYEKLKRIK